MEQFCSLEENILKGELGGVRFASLEPSEGTTATLPTTALGANTV